MYLKNALRFIKFFIGWPVSALSIIFIVKIVLSNQSISQSIGGINLVILALGLLAFLPYFFIRALIWQTVLKEKGNIVELRQCAFLWESSEIKRFVPGFIWPLVSRTMAFSNKRLTKKEVAYSLFVEVEAFLLGCMLLSLFSIPFVFYHLPINVSLKLFAVVVFLILTITLTLLFIFATSVTSFIKRFKNLPAADKPLAREAKNALSQFSFWTNFKLLTLSVTSLFFFGLGTYLTIVSIAFLSPALFLNLIGLFVLSMLIGYLSFITPMGLGVREAVLISGLSALMPIPLASASAIYARIGLVISELIFFQFTIIVHNAKHKFFIKIWDYLSSHKQEVLVAMGIFIYIAYFTTASFLRYDNFYTGRFDLGNMDQTVWNTIRGRIFQTTDGTVTTSRLGSHADFILILISPLYKIWADPRMLLLLQAIVVGLGAVFIYKIAKMILGSKNAAAVFSFIFLLNPSLEYSNLYDFHPVTLATTLLLGAFYFFMRKKHILFLVFAVLAGLAKEEIWLIVAIFGLYTLVFEFIKLARKKITLKSKKTLFNFLFGFLVASISIFIFYYLIWIAIPAVRGGNHFALSYYSDFGDSPLNVVKNILLSPGKIFQIMLMPKRLLYLGALLSPVGFLSLLSPVVLVFALPDLLINLLSSDSNLYQIFYQYTAAITPFIFISAIFGVKNLDKWFPKKQLLNILLVFIALTTLMSAYFFGPLPGALHPNLDMFTKQLEDRDLIQAFISGIPTRYKVAATNNLGSHLSRRRNVFTIPQGVDSADVIVFLLNDPFAQPSLLQQKKMVEKLKENPSYKLLFKEDAFIAFQKKSLNYNIRRPLNL